MSVQTVEKIQSFYSIVGCVKSVLSELAAKELRSDKPAMVAYHMQKVKENIIPIYRTVTKSDGAGIKDSIPVFSVDDTGCTEVRLVNNEKEYINLRIHQHTVEIVTESIVYKFTMPFVSAP